MHGRNGHLTDEEALLAADCELGGTHKEEVRDHLAACAECRTRVAEMEAALERVVELQQ